jgi:RNA polymerase sigma-70 factor (ECF subfamily)
VNEQCRLAHAARQGEPGAIEAFITLSHPQVRWLCASLVDEQSADDLTQETFVRALRAIRRFRGESTARTWLLSIARNVCMDELRARTRQRRKDSENAQLSELAAIAPDVAEEVGVRDLLQRLDPDRRIAFVLTQLVRMTYEEAAEVCGCPVGTIRSRVARARDDLIRLVSDTHSPKLRDAVAGARPGASA